VWRTRNKVLRNHSFDLKSVLPELSKLLPRDVRVSEIGKTYSVAQYVSLDADLSPRTSVLNTSSALPRDPKAHLSALFDSAPSHRVNVRIFSPGTSTGALFFSAVETVEGVIELITNHIVEQGYAIVSEMIDLDDGGVAGVLYGDIVEFKQGETPKFVDRQRSDSFPQLRRDAAERMLQAIYGSDVDLSKISDSMRVEFSTHPQECGTPPARFLVWDCYEVAPQHSKPRLVWPNSFSEWLGDKCFGLLAAWCMDFRVPKTLAVLNPLMWDPVSGRGRSRWTPAGGVAFGEETGGHRVWTRTCPAHRMPGRYPTFSTRHDPFALMLRADPEGKHLRSVLDQQDVAAEYSGAGQVTEGALIIEGVSGTGTDLMMGTQSPEQLPTIVGSSIHELSQKLYACFGACRFEWAWKERCAWLLQVNLLTSQIGDTATISQIRSNYIEFDPDTGLDELDRVIRSAKLEDRDVLIIKRVGITSHVCELLNGAGVRFAIVPTPGRA
jgi:hypothetical protein